MEGGATIAVSLTIDRQIGPWKPQRLNIVEDWNPQWKVGQEENWWARKEEEYNWWSSG